MHNDDLQINYRSNIFISLKELVFLEGDGNYTNFIFRNQPKYISARTLKYFADDLTQKGFIRIHRSILVNKKFIATTNIIESSVILIDGTKLTISRRRLKEVFQCSSNMF